MTPQTTNSILNPFINVFENLCRIIILQMSSIYAVDLRHKKREDVERSIVISAIPDEGNSREAPGKNDQHIDFIMDTLMI